MFPGNCFRCGGPGHLAAECPELRPAASRAEHEWRLKAYRQRFDNWIDGTPGVKWNPEQKTNAIRIENEMWKDREKEAARK